MSAPSGGRYLDYGSKITAPSPVICEDVTQYVFEVDVGAPGGVILANLCSLFATASAGYSTQPVVNCSPLKSAIFLQFNTIEWVGGAYNVGVEETEMLIHVPVKFSVAHQAIKDQEALFTPYIWVNNSVAMAGGREVYGFPKAFGNIKIAADRKGNPTLLMLKTLSELNNRKMMLTDLVTVTRQSPTARGINDLTEVIREFEQQRNIGDPFVRLVGNWLVNGTVKQLFLKQFRESDGTLSSCCQQILSADYSTDLLPTSTPVDGKYALAIVRSNTAPLHTEVGLPGKLIGTRQVKINKLFLGTGTVHWQMEVPHIP
jgi:hypothetical protein